MMQQILVGLGALIDPLENSPGFLAESSNHSFSAGKVINYGFGIIEKVLH